MVNLIKNIAFFRRNQNGSTLVEFVLVFFVFMTFILTSLELGIMLAIKVNLQSCAQSGAYYGATGAYNTGSTRTASAQAVMTNGISGIMNTSNVVITIQSFATFAVASLGAAGVTGTGLPGQVSMYKIQYTYTPATPLVASYYGKTKVLQATTYTKNELTFPS